MASSPPQNDLTTRFIIAIRTGNLPEIQKCIAEEVQLDQYDRGIEVPIATIGSFYLPKVPGQNARAFLSGSGYPFIEAIAYSPEPGKVLDILLPAMKKVNINPFTAVFAHSDPDPEINHRYDLFNFLLQTYPSHDWIARPSATFPNLGERDLKTMLEVLQAFERNDIDFQKFTAINWLTRLPGANKPSSETFVDLLKSFSDTKIYSDTSKMPKQEVEALQQRKDNSAEIARKIQNIIELHSKRRQVGEETTSTYRDLYESRSGSDKGSWGEDPFRIVGAFFDWKDFQESKEAQKSLEQNSGKPADRKDDSDSPPPGKPGSKLK